MTHRRTWIFGDILFLPGWFIFTVYLKQTAKSGLAWDEAVHLWPKFWTQVALAAAIVCLGAWWVYWWLLRLDLVEAHAKQKTTKWVDSLLVKWCLVVASEMHHMEPLLANLGWFLTRLIREICKTRLVTDCPLRRAQGRLVLFPRSTLGHLPSRGRVGGTGTHWQSSSPAGMLI